MRKVKMPKVLRLKTAKIVVAVCLVASAIAIIPMTTAHANQATALPYQPLTICGLSHTETWNRVTGQLTTHASLTNPACSVVVTVAYTYDTPSGGRATKIEFSSTFYDVFYTTQYAPYQYTVKMDFRVCEIYTCQSVVAYK